MGDLINLTRYRKQRRRSDKERSAAENRAKYGRTKSEKRSTAQIRALEETKLADARMQKRSNSDDNPEAD